jgi:GNAT superfamily N-acetyltransferase
MKIVQAVPQDLVEVLYLLKVCVNDMNEKGQKHWNNAYPGTEIMTKAIENKTLYLYKDLGITKGLIVLSHVEPEEYKDIDWPCREDKVLFLRFLTVHPLWQDAGIEKKLVEFAETFAKENKFSTIRVDIYSGVNGAEKLCVDMGFSQAGKFHSKFQQTPYFAYEKSL